MKIQNSSKKILLLITQMEAGGAQKAILQLARGLLNNGHNVFTVTMYEKHKCIDQFEAQYGLQIINLAMKNSKASIFKNILHFFSGLISLFHLMRKEKFDILQTFTHYSNIIGMVMGYIAKIPIRISSQRGILQNESYLFLLLDRVITNSRIVHKMVAVSKNTSKYCIEVEKIRPKKLITIENGIDINEFDSRIDHEQILIIKKDLGIKKKDLILTIVGRLHPVKGHKIVIECVKEIIKTVPNLHLLIAGDGELKEELQILITKLNISSHVHLLGQRNDIPSILMLTDIFVLPSKCEGMPNAILEAMSAKLPVIATSIDGIAEVVINRETGLLIESNNPEALKRAMLEMLLNMDMRIAFGKSGRMRIEQHFSLSTFVTKFENLYLSFYA